MKNDNRFTIIKGKDIKTYVFDRYIFLSIIGILILIMIGAIIFNGGFDANEYIYITCNSESGCSNPLYNNTAYCGKTIDINDYICNQEFLPYGFEAGKKPPKIIKAFSTITISLLLLGFILNHILYNRKQKRVV